MALAIATHENGWLSFPLTGQAAHTADAAGTLGYVVNPEGETIIVTRCIVYNITASAGAANVTVGTNTTVAGCHDTTELSAAIDAVAAVGTAVVGFAYGDAADALPVVAAGSVFAAFGSGDTTGYTGICYVEYIHA